MHSLNKTQKFEPHDKKCILLGVAHTQPSGTVRVCNLATSRCETECPLVSVRNENKLEDVMKETDSGSSKKADQDSGSETADSGVVDVHETAGEQ